MNSSEHQNLTTLPRYKDKVYDEDLYQDSQEWKDTQTRLKANLPRYRVLWLTYHQEQLESRRAYEIEDKLDNEYEADDEMVICCDKQACNCGFSSFVPPEFLEIEDMMEYQSNPTGHFDSASQDSGQEENQSVASSSSGASSSGDSTCVAFDVSWLPSPDTSQASKDGHINEKTLALLDLKDVGIHKNHENDKDDDELKLRSPSLCDNKESDVHGKNSFPHRETIIIDSDHEEEIFSTENFSRISEFRSSQITAQFHRGSLMRQNNMDYFETKSESGSIKHVNKEMRKYRRIVIDSSDEESTHISAKATTFSDVNVKRNRIIVDDEDEENDDIDNDEQTSGLLEKIKALSLRNENTTQETDESDYDNDGIDQRRRSASKTYFDLEDSDDSKLVEASTKDSRKTSPRKLQLEVKHKSRRRNSFIVDSDDEESDDDSDDSSDIDSLDLSLPSRNGNSRKPKPSDKISKLSFRRNREQIAQALFAEYDVRVFDGKLSKNTTVQWSKKLRTTAGLTRLKHVRQGKEVVGRTAVVELSTKVLEDVDRLRATLMHELCHAAQWLEDGVSKPPHGDVFKKWAKIATRRMPQIPVTVKHDYEISFKYRWKCVQCNRMLKRHSRSINIETHVCGHCHGRLIEVDADGTMKSKTAQRNRPLSAYNQFIKETSSKVRSQLEKNQTEKVTQAQVLKHCARLWKENNEREQMVQA